MPDLGSKAFYKLHWWTLLFNDNTTAIAQIYLGTAYLLDNSTFIFSYKRFLLGLHFHCSLFL